MERWSREVVQAARRLTHAPVFSGTVLLVFIVSIGIATSVTSLALGIFRQAVPYEQAFRIVQLYETNLSQDVEFMQNSIPTSRVWQEEATIFEHMGLAHAPLNVTLSTREGTERLIAGLASPSLFATLDIDMAEGRPFGADEEGVGTAAQSVVISYEWWTSELGADPDVIGGTLTINGVPWTVVGVLQPRTPLLPVVGTRIDVWIPIGHAEMATGRDVSQIHSYRAFWILARLRPDVDEVRMREEVDVISARISEMFPETSGGWDWEIRPLSDGVTQNLRGPTVTLVVGALLLLLVAVANAIGLFVQRARRSVRAASVRLAVGAMRSDLTRAAGTEAALLVIPGTLAGFLLAWLAIESYGTWTPFPLPPFMEIALDPQVIGGALLLALTTVAAVGLLTGWWWWRSAAGTGSRLGTSASKTWNTARFGLVLQIALAAMLTVTGLMTARSFRSLVGADVGLQPEKLLTARVDVPAELRPVDQLSTTADEILDRLRALPDISEAALWSPHVPAEAIWYSRVAVFSRPDLQEMAEMPLVRIHQIGHRAATLIGLQFVRGRDFTLDDRTSGRRVALVSESAAREWWGEENPIDRRIRRWNHDEWSTVVGVVRDTPLAGRQGEGADFVRDVFFLHDQDPQAYLVFLMRIRGDAPDIGVSSERAIRSAAPDLPVYGVRFMDEILSDQEDLSRSTAMLGVIFAIAALVLVGVGLYGILANVVSQKAPEISLRKALGATTGRIVREVTTPAFFVLFLGGTTGLLAARSLLPRMMVDSLFGVAPTDLALYLAAAVVLVAATVPALIGPAARGSRQDPVEALRRGIGG